MTPGQSAYEAYRKHVPVWTPEWRDMAQDAQSPWEDAGRAVLADRVGPPGDQGSGVRF